MNPSSYSPQQIVWEPRGPQKALIACPIFDVFFGGSRGGGKTDGLIGDFMAHAAKEGVNANAKFFRKSRLQLSEVVERTKQLFPQLGGRFLGGNVNEWRFASGARLGFGYLERDSDADAYQGHNYSRLYFEELGNWNNPAPIDKLFATVRSGVEGVKTGVRSSGNPGGVGHNWIKARYIDPCPKGMRPIPVKNEISVGGITKTVSFDRLFIPSFVQDNPTLFNSPTYLAQLAAAGSASLVKAWLEGDWNVVNGAYFDKLDFGTHSFSKTMQIPEHWYRFRAFDWGSSKPFSCGWYAVSDGTVEGFPPGALLRYKEWYGWNGKPDTGLKMHAKDVALGILKRDEGEIIPTLVADPAIFQQHSGPSIAETFLINGLAPVRADNSRIPGWTKLREALDDLHPMLFISDACEQFWRTVPTLQHSPTHPEDVNTAEEDHIGDEVRYANMWRAQMNSLPRVNVEPIKGMLEIPICDWVIPSPSRDASLSTRY